MWTIIKYQLKRVRKDREFYSRVRDEETIVRNLGARIQSGACKFLPGSSPRL